MGRTARVAGWVLVCALGSVAGTGGARADDASTLRAALEASDADRFFEADQIARGASDPLVADIALWRRLTKGEGGWAEYRAFIATHPDWPDAARIRRHAERAMPVGLDPDQTLDFISGDGGDPTTGAGALRLADALAAKGRAAAASAVIEQAWRTLSLTAGERDAMVSRWASVIAPHHDARMDMLLWRGLSGEAEWMKRFVSPGWRALADARIRLRARSNGVDAAIEAVPASLQNDAGLAYERFVWRMRADRYDDAEPLIMLRSTSAASLGEPGLWGKRRALLARRALRLNRPQAAYALASSHFMTPADGYDYADLEWISGWIALRRLGDPQQAVAHFRNFSAAVETPISVGRGGYWLGRALEAAGDGAGAREAYGRAAAQQTAFYGLMAAEKIGAAPDPALLGSGAPANWRDAPVAGRPALRAARLLQQAGHPRRAHWFLTTLAGALSTERDLDALAGAAADMGRLDASIRIAKIAAQKGFVLHDRYYPLHPLHERAGPVEPAFALAIARQESEMNIEAVSPAGARGIMQLMPFTARKVAGELGLPYEEWRLTGDWPYNAALGTRYLADQLATFGSPAMAAAAYNAGPNRVDQWIGRYGDPRLPGVDLVDWLESIPFSETRNYVQRVMEGIYVYRSRLAGRSQPIAMRALILGR